MVVIFQQKLIPSYISLIVPVKIWYETWGTIHYRSLNSSHVCKQSHFFWTTNFSLQDTYAFKNSFITNCDLPYSSVWRHFLSYQSNVFTFIRFTTVANILKCSIVPIAVKSQCFARARHYQYQHRCRTNKIHFVQYLPALRLVLNYLDWAVSRTIQLERFPHHSYS